MERVLAATLETIEKSPTPEAVAQALNVALGLYVRRLRQIRGSDSELTLPQMATLIQLDRNGPSTASEIAKTEQISRQAVGAILIDLEAKGLVERRPHPEDGRKVLLAISDVGRRLLGGRRGERTVEVAKAIAKLSESERRTLLDAAHLIERMAGT